MTTTELAAHCRDDVEDLGVLLGLKPIATYAGLPIEEVGSVPMARCADGVYVSAKCVIDKWKAERAGSWSACISYLQKRK